MASTRKLFAKGKRSHIYLTTYKNKKAIIKTSDPKSEAKSSILKETYWLKKLNKEKIGPKLYYSNEKEVIMEYIKGLTLPEWTKTATKKEILTVLQKILDQCNTLDKLGITKEEMHNPYKHIIIRNKKPVFIDFERAIHSLNPKNTTQFVQYLSTGNYKKQLEETGIMLNVIKSRNLLKNYKKNLKQILIKELL